MELVHREIPKVDILELHGRVDAYEVLPLHAWYDAHPYLRHIIVDLSHTTFIDSSGLAALVKGLKLCKNNGGNLYLYRPTKAVRAIIQMTRLDKAFGVFANRDDLLTALKATARNRAIQ